MLIMSAINPELEQQPQLWGGTTDPTSHDPTNFRYLVYAINPFAKLNALQITSLDRKDGITYDKSWGDQSISMYDEPERVADRVSLSMSLIDQDHTETWGNAGLIVEAPEDNVIITETKDAGSHNNNLDFLTAQAQKRYVMDGDTLINSSYPESYNEVVAVANRDGKQLRLKGFFYKTTSTGEPLDDTITRRIKSHAERLGLPVVAIAKKSPYGVDKVKQYSDYDDKDHKYIAVHYNGCRYLLDGFDERNQFMVYDEKGSAHFAAPHEIEAAIGYAVATNGLSESGAKRIAEAYNSADKQRQTPTAVFDKDGELERIVYRTGYGEREMRINLYKSGYGSCANVAEEARKIRDMMHNIDKRMMIYSSSSSPPPVSPAEADKMVEAACTQLNESQATIVKQWYAEHRDIIAKNQQDYAGRSQRLGSIGLIGFDKHF